MRKIFLSNNYSKLSSNNILSSPVIHLKKLAQFYSKNKNFPTYNSNNKHPKLQTSDEGPTLNLLYQLYNLIISL
jgi:hypothetical protein